jgi:hypothetical protein
MFKLVAMHNVNKVIIKTYSLFDRFFIVMTGNDVTITPIDKTEVLHLNDVMMIKGLLHTI